MTAVRVLHVVNRMAIGGLENGLVNLINHLPEGEYQHTIVSLTFHTDFVQRLKREVQLIDLDRRQGKDFSLHGKLWRCLRRVRPHVVHSRNLATLEAQAVAFAARVPVRIHGEHGWDIHDMEGSSRKYRLLRRLHRPFVHRYVALSQQFEDFLRGPIGVPRERIRQICNGVDVDRFRPAGKETRELFPRSFRGPEKIVFGTVGRMEAVKDQVTLARAFVRLLERQPASRERVRLAMVGDGSLRPEVGEVISRAGLESLVWMPGAREEIPELMRGFDVFVLPSQAEGISNTILEAMASGLPVVATSVGGNLQLVDEGVTGRLVPPRDPERLAEAMAGYLAEPGRVEREGGAARKRAVERYSIRRMVDEYHGLYQELLVEKGLNPAP